MPAATPTPTPIEILARFVSRLCESIGGQKLGGVLGGRIPVPLLLLIDGRIRTLRDRFARLATRILAGTYRPRRAAPRRQPIASRPRQPSPFRKSGWLAALLPEAMATEYRGELNALLQQPETAALIAAAPGPMARLLRPLCQMLKLKPPAFLPGARRAAAMPPTTYRPPPPRPPPAEAPTDSLGIPLICYAPPRPKTA